MRELENAITSSDQTLASDETQLAKSIAQHSGDGDIGIVDGTSTPDAIVLVAHDSRKLPPTLTKGLRVRFKATDVNASVNVTIKYGSFAALGVHDGQLPNGGTPTIVSSYIQPDCYYTVYYDKTPDGLTEYWRFDAVSLSQVGSGIREFDTDSRITFVGTASEANVTHRNTASTYDAVSGSSYKKRTDISGNGVTYYAGSSGPGDLTTRTRTVTYDISSKIANIVSTQVYSGAYDLYLIVVDTTITLTGIPDSTTVHSMSIETEEDAAGDDINCSTYSGVSSSFQKTKPTDGDIVLSGLRFTDRFALSDTSTDRMYLKVVIDPSEID